MTHTRTSLPESQRFAPPDTRRDFLGLAAAWSAIAAFVMAMLGSLRLPMPSVFPESNSQVKLGRPEAFLKGTPAYFPQHRLWVFRDEQGLHALSSVCTHLGCIAERGENGQFKCPCHGSVFAADGALLGGPAPKGLVWVELTVSPEGALVADTLKAVPAGTVLKV